MGALGFTAMAHKKWQSVLQYIKLKDLNSLYESCGNLDEFRMSLKNFIPNIGDITCNTIANQWSFFKEDIDFILRWNLIDSYGLSSSDSVQIRFTGVRNKQLQEQLNTLGYDADDSSVTKNTKILIVPYDGFSSSKVQKAMKNQDIKIISIDKFLANQDLDSLKTFTETLLI